MVANECMGVHIIIMVNHRNVPQTCVYMMYIHVCTCINICRDNPLNGRLIEMSKALSRDIRAILSTLHAGRSYYVPLIEKS